MKMDYFLGLSEEGFHRVHYLEWGNKAEKPALICVHGMTRNAHDFDALAASFSQQGRHVFCPDLVGRGDSDWLQNPLHYTYEQYLADMNTLIARTDDKHIDWIGTSLGGLIGMILASLPQSPIQRLVLNDIGPQISTKALARLTTYAGHDPEFASIADAKRYFRSIYSDFGKLSDAQWQHLTENSIRETASGKFIAKLDQRIKFSMNKSKIAWQAMLHPQKAWEGTLFDVDLWHIWRKVRCPVLVIHGVHSDILVPDTIQKMQQIHPDVTVINIEDAGHAPHLLDESLQNKIYQWLEK